MSTTTEDDLHTECLDELMARHPEGPTGFTWDRFREAAQQVAAERGEWAGAPMLAEDIPLVLEPRYPYQGLNGKCLSNLIPSHGVPDPPEGWEIVNTWWSEQRACNVYIVRETATGKQDWFWAMDNGWPHRWNSMLNAMDPVRYMDVHAESRALRTLQGMLTPNCFRHYFLLGYFLETSKRSGIVYLFRKLRPTLAMSPRPDGRHGARLIGDESKMRILTSLCLHPIGFYEGTHLGVMVPTDDVIAHLLLMRGDERKFWSKANHHPPHTWQAGI